MTAKTDYAKAIVEVLVEQATARERQDFELVHRLGLLLRLLRQRQLRFAEA